MVGGEDTIQGKEDAVRDEHTFLTPVTNLKRLSRR